MKPEPEKMTEEKYQELIPKHCLYQTAALHREVLMYCWGILCGFVKPETAKKDCEGCEFNTNERAKMK